MDPALHGVRKTRSSLPELLLQLRVLGFSLLVDGDVGIGVLPESEEVFVGSECSDAGCIGIRSLRGSRLQGIGASHSQMHQSSGPAVHDDAAVVENFLELGSGSGALSGCEISLTTNVCWIEAGIPKFDGWRSGFSAPSSTVALTTINRWVSGSLRRRASIRAATIHIVSFQPLPKLEESGFRWQGVWSVACITQKRKEDAMKTKTNVKAGQRIATR
jgi:hypothetical protein